MSRSAKTPTTPRPSRSRSMTPNWPLVPTRLHRWSRSKPTRVCSSSTTQGSLARLIPPSRLLQTMWPSTAKPRSRSTPAMPKSRRCSKLAAKPPCSMFLQVLTSESTAPSTSMCLVKSSAVRLPSKLPATTFPSPQATCLQASVSVSQATSLTHSLG